jgi:hypothetical protein
MAELTPAQRARLKASDFALPGGRYPIPNRSHAANALARVSQFGNAEEKAAVRKAVCDRYPDLPACKGK